MRWPFGPPHLTLKPSNKKHQKKKKKQTNKTKPKQNQKKTKERKKRKPQTPKNSFSVISQFFPFLGVAFQKFPFLTPWPKKPEPKKHYKNRGFRPFFLKSCCASRNGHFWTKKPQIYKFELSFFLPIFFSFNNRKHKNLLKPLFL